MAGEPVDGGGGNGYLRENPNKYTMIFAPEAAKTNYIKQLSNFGIGGGGEPSAYIKSASVVDNTLTLTNKDDTTVDYNGEPSAYLKNASVSNNTLTITNKDDTTITFTPSGGITEERVNELIDTKLNAIPNAEGGAY